MAESVPPAAMEFPWSGEVIPESEETVYDAFPKYRERRLATFGPDRVVYSADVTPILRQLYNTPLHAQDLWVMTPPKCGENPARVVAPEAGKSKV